MGKNRPASEPLGSRQTGRDGKPVTEGWNYDRTMKPKDIDTRQVEQYPEGNQHRGDAR